MSSSKNLLAYALAALLGSALCACGDGTHSNENAAQVTSNNTNATGAHSNANANAHRSANNNASHPINTNTTGGARNMP